MYLFSRECVTKHRDVQASQLSVTVSHIRPVNFRTLQRPMVDMELRYEIITGSHITPLTQNVFINTPIDSIDPLYGVRQSMKKEFLKTVNHLGQMLVDWLEESTPPNPPASTAAAEGLPLIAVGQVDPASRL